MPPTDSPEPPNSEPPKNPPPPSKVRIKQWFHCKRDDPPLAVVLRTGSSHLTVEENNDVNRESNAFEIDLPRWRNRVHVYADMEKREGYAATIRLDRLGWKRNWRRRLGWNYSVLHVKGKKMTLPV